MGLLRLRGRIRIRFVLSVAKAGDIAGYFCSFIWHDLAQTWHEKIGGWLKALINGVDEGA